MRVYVEISEFMYYMLFMYTCMSKFIGNLIIEYYEVQSSMILHLREML